MPTFQAAAAFGSHDPGTPGGSGLFYQQMPVTAGSAVLTAPFAPHTDAFTVNGSAVSTKANGGIGRTQSSTTAKVSFATGTGVDQSDPGHKQGTSSFQLDFDVRWTINNGSFGPPISTSFSVPVGVKTGSAGSASFSCDVNWYFQSHIYYEEPVLARPGYSDSRTWGANQNNLYSFTAPAAPFSPSALVAGDQIWLKGYIRFEANNDTDPADARFPTAADLATYTGFEPGKTAADYAFEPGMGVAEEPVPEPSSAAAAQLLPAAGLLRRRRRAGR